MKKTIAVTLAIAAAASTNAFAADAIIAYDPPPAPAPIVQQSAFDWNGAYVGASAGYLFDNSTRVTARDPAGDQFSRRFIKGSDGFTGGVYGGYNFSSNGFVYGVEANVDYSGKNASRETFGGAATTRSRVGVNGAARARVGVAADEALFYVAGGVAGANLRHSVTDVSGTTTRTKAKYGYTVGAGVDYAVTPNVLLRAEYNFTDYGKRDLATGAGTYTFDTKTHGLKLGVGYKF